MFKELRYKLTITNVLVVGLIFILAFSSIYFLMARSISRQSDYIMGLIASDAQAGLSPTFPADRLKYRKITCFYAKTSPLGEIILYSPELPISPEDLRNLVKNAMAQQNTRGKLHTVDDDYRFLKINSISEAGFSFIVFASTRMEDEILNRLLIVLMVIGFAGLLLAFFGSLFMAERALIPIKNSWERQKNFVADASHELRTPLSVIQTNLELVMSNPQDTVESQVKWLENIKAENNRLVKLVSDLLFLARADSHQANLEMKRFSLPSALKSALAPFEPVAQKKGLRLETYLEPVPEFYGDENRINQLALILLDNAMEHTPSGGTVRVELRTRLSNVEIVVADTGEGIDKEHLERIFERFYRIDKARSRQSGNIGLGLAIAQWIVKEHRGQIIVSSSPGEGTTFQVTLPMINT